MSETQLIVLIAALDRNRAIGRDNALPWHLPDDLKRFKALTLGKPILMGRKTAESLGRALPGRRNLVLTREGQVPFSGMEPVTSIEDAFAMTAADDADTLCVIGGGEIYALMLPLATHMYLCHVDTAIDRAGTYFPQFDAAQWRIVSRQTHAADSQHAFAFENVDYVRLQTTIV